MAESRLILTLAALIGIAIPGAWVFSLVTPGEEAVKIRNGLVVSMGSVGDFDWIPQETPASFLVNRTSPSPEFTRLVADLAEDQTRGRLEGLDLAVALSRHLMGGTERRGGAIQAGLDDTYRGIVRRGRGYCADFTRVFSGLAIAAGLPVRTWSISFDTFGAGHSFSEIYDERLAKWVLVDSFHSLYFIDAATLKPLSVLEVHDRLLAMGPESPELTIQTIVEDRMPFRSHLLALDYYRRGMPQLALVWGNNVFDYDRSTLIRWSAAISRHLERAVAIGSGQFPDLRVYPKAVSQRDVAALFRARDRFIMAVASLALAAIVFGWLLVSTWRRPFVRATGSDPSR